MKRILNIAASLKVGGAEKVARDIGLFGDPQKFEHHYVVFHQDIGTYEEQILAHGGKVFHMQNPSRNYFVYLRSLRTLMKENSYDAVHAHTMFNCGWAMLAAKQMCIPVRITHAHSALDNGNRITKRIYEACMRFLILRYSTDLVACGEKAGIRLFGEKCYRERGNLVLNGVDVNAFRFSPEARDRIRQELSWQDSFLIGHVGHLNFIKNQSFLLELMPHILQLCPNARLIMLGEGEDRAMLEQKIQAFGLSDKVKIPGNVSNVADYLSAMDVFVFPSHFEGMPLSVLEVQANGLPCVISTGVPKDVYLTDLIHPLALSEDKKRWSNAIVTARRSNSEDYASRLRAAGFDLAGPMKKIYRIYNRE